jgi:hypothetical protein
LLAFLVELLQRAPLEVLPPDMRQHVYHVILLLELKAELRRHLLEKQFQRVYLIIDDRLPLANRYRRQYFQIFLMRNPLLQDVHQTFERRLRDELRDGLVVIVK